MEKLRLEVGQTPVVHVRSVGGDLRLVGMPGTVLEAKGASREEVSARQEAGSIDLTSPAGCLIYLPQGATVEVGSVGGDGRVTDLHGGLTIDHVNGDLTVRRTSGPQIRQVDGDLSARDLSGDLVVSSIGGSAKVDTVQGECTLGSIGGDVTLRGIRGDLRVTAGGDGAAALTPRPGGDSSLEVGGDLAVRLPVDASVRLRLQAGGDMALALPAAAEREGDATVVRLGSSGAELALRAAGDLSVRLGGTPNEPPFGSEWQEDLAGRVEAQVEAALSQAESAWRDAGGGMEAAARVRDQVRRSIDRARGHRWRSEAPSRRGGEMPPASGEAGAVGSEERMQILRMLEKGTISVEQAEKLFEALEGKS